MNRFWNFTTDGDTGERTLYLCGVIAEEPWYGDEVTPAAFKAELLAAEGDIIVWVNSPGGDMLAASQIYNMLMAYKGNVTVKIDSIAASAASVIAMAGKKVLISPTGLIMIHDPASVAIGNTDEMRKAIQMLDEVKESIINAYEMRTGLSRARLSHLMSSETWLNANMAIELGFADDLLFKANKEQQPANGQYMAENGYTFSCKTVSNSLLAKIAAKMHKAAPAVTAVIQPPGAEPTAPPDYEPPDPPFVDAVPREAVGAAATEAPRGLLFHRYRIGGDGLIKEARIVPPTAQNLRAMEADLRGFVQDHLDIAEDRLTLLCEQVVRNHDPCISCATHFLKLRIERD